MRLKNDGKIEKALKPSQRKSITEFSSKFGTGTSYEEKLKYRMVIKIAVAVLSIILLVYFGFFFTDTILRITEIV